MIVTVTLNPGIDHNLLVPEIRFDDVLRAVEVSDNWGGKGLNVSRALKALGVESTATGFLGGAAGQKLEAGLRSLGIAADFVRIDGETRTNTVIMEEGTGRHVKVNEPGPVVQQEDLDRLFEKVAQKASPGSTWVFCGSLPPGAPKDTYERLVALVQTKGGQAILDSSGASLRSGCQAVPYLIKPNLKEAEEASGIAIHAEEDAARVADYFLRQGIRLVALSMGAQGLLLASREQVARVRCPQVPAQNPTGAGDALLAGLIFALQRGLPLEDCARWGVAAGTVSAGRPDVSFGSLEEVEKLYTKIRKG